MTDRKGDKAFGPLDDRAGAMSGPDPLDRISLRDHIVSVEIGAFQSERDAVQRLSFNVVVEVTATNGAALDDDVDKILSYDTITTAIATELAAERLNLLETLAEKIAARLLAEPQAARVFVRIEKLDRGPGALGVEIVRTRQAAPAPETAPSETRGPLVVCLDQTAIGSPHLSHWLDQLQRLGRAVLFVTPTPAPARRAETPAAQERINLLEMEQAAWQLASRDDRLAVVESRTELTHAVQTRLSVVWAPSKMVTDTFEDMPFDANDVSQLVAWFAKQQGAHAVLSIGGDAGHEVGRAELDLEALGDG